MNFLHKADYSAIIYECKTNNFPRFDKTLMKYLQVRVSGFKSYYTEIYPE